MLNNPRENLDTENVERRGVHEKLKELLSSIALGINIEVAEKFGLKKLLDSECKILMESYADPEKGIYDREIIEESTKEVKDREREFSRAALPQVREYYASEYNAHTEEDIIRVWKENKIKEKGGQMEMVVTALLHRLLGKRYLVVRTADYDDYLHGVDNLIIDKETGVVVCAFDDVHEGGESESMQAKQAKITRIAKHGGASLRFGLKYENDELKRSRLDNLPIFYLGLRSNELWELMRNMSYDMGEKPSSVELATFTKLTESVRAQLASLKKEELPFAVRRNLQRFEDSLPALNKTSIKRAKAA